MRCAFAVMIMIGCWHTALATNKLIVNNPDDREDSIPTNWWTYSHQSPTDVSNTITNQNARIVDITVEQFSPSYLFTVTYVQDAGPYFKGWWWYYGLDAATLSNHLSTNNARLISLKAYDIGGGQLRFAVAMVYNAGKDAKSWWWYYGQSPSQIASNLTANNARLVQLQSYVTGGQTVYAVVMIANTGNDAKGWWWYTDTTAAQITSLASTNNARVVDLDYIPADGNYNVIMESCSGGCPAWWTYYGQSASQMLALASANGARIIDNNPYPGCGDLCFSFVLIDNSLPPLDSSNEIVSRVGQLLRAGGVTGVQGLYLKAVGGSVLANLEDSFVYEPASSIKVLAHLYSMTQVQNGSVTLSTPVTHYTNGPGSCPDPATVSGTEPLSTGLREMMWHSDNARTREITDTFGDPAINSFGSSIGMLNSRINHIIGCGGPIPDQLTLDDAGTLYEGVANGSILTTPNRTTFYSLMAGKAQFQTEGYDWSHLWDTDIPNIIAQSAPGTTTSQQQGYKNQMNLAYKAGSYVLCDASCTKIAEYFSITGLAEIPFCSGASTTLKDYVFGIYLHGALDGSWFSGKNTVADQNFTAAKAETLREQMVTGLASCGLAPTTVAIISGQNQSAAVNTAFAPLKVTVTDANGNPVPNAVVTFTAPGTGPSGTFGSPCNGAICMVTANGSGLAVAPTFTANGSAGSFTVIASFNGHTTTFNLTNAALGVFVPMTPCRVVDTRASQNFAMPFGAPSLVGGGFTTSGGPTRSFPIPTTTNCSIPSNAVAYSFNVTVVPQGPLGFLVIWPTGQPRPNAVTVDDPQGLILNNAAIVPAGTSGSVDVFASQNTDLVIDINGYYVATPPPAGSLVFVPITPCRVVDTRASQNFPSPFGAPSLVGGGFTMSGGPTRTFPIPTSANCTIPANAKAYSFNVTAIPPGSLGFLVIWPTGQPRPNAVTVDDTQGQILNNAAFVPAGMNGSVDVFASQNTDLAIDINGYFIPAPSPLTSSSLVFVPVTPCRVVDTRASQNFPSPFGAPSLVGGGFTQSGGPTRTFPIQSSPNCSIPSNAMAYSFNVTVIPPGSLGFLVLWPTGQPRPNAVTVDDTQGLILNNAAIVPAGMNGSVDVFASQNTDLAIDINGCFVPGTTP